MLDLQSKAKCGPCNQLKDASKDSDMNNINKVRTDGEGGGDLMEVVTDPPSVVF